MRSLPTDTEATANVQAGMDVLMREKARDAMADCARGLIRTAREWKAMGRPDEAARLVRNARWYWRWYLREAGL